MNEYEVKVKVIETHYLIINADNEEDAINKLKAMELILGTHFIQM
jgi:hypothetical protein